MTRVRGSLILSGVAVLAAVLLIVASTGAVVLDGPTDPLSDEAALQPGDNPYTYLDENGELVIDITEDNLRLDADGVNANALTVEDELFYVVYNGSEPAEVWIDHDSQAVTFVARGEPVETGEDPLLVTPDDERVAVGVAIDTRVAEVVPGDRLIDEITVRARSADLEAITQDDEAGEGDGSDGTGDDGGDRNDDESFPSVVQRV